MPSSTPGIKPKSSTLQVNSLPSEPVGYIKVKKKKSKGKRKSFRHLFIFIIEVLLSDGEHEII